MWLHFKGGIILWTCRIGKGGVSLVCFALLPWIDFSCLFALQSYCLYLEVDGTYIYRHLGGWNLLHFLLALIGLLCDGWLFFRVGGQNNKIFFRGQQKSSFTSIFNNLVAFWLPNAQLIWCIKSRFTFQVLALPIGTPASYRQCLCCCAPWKR